MTATGLSSSSLLDETKPYNWRDIGRFLGSGLERCMLCMTAHTDATLCAACVLDLPWRADQTVRSSRLMTPVKASFYYEFPLIQLISQGKFSGNVGVLELLAHLMAKHCPFGDLEGVVVCPIPVSYRRHLARGYNQSWVIACALAKELALPVRADWLERAVHSAPQRGLRRKERGTNVRNAFRSNAGLQGRRVLLVDDVVTTGATLEAAQASLVRAGAAEVLIWACAAVP